MRSGEIGLIERDRPKSVNLMKGFETSDRIEVEVASGIGREVSRMSGCLY